MTCRANVLDGSVVGIQEFIDNSNGRVVVRGIIKTKYVVQTVSTNDSADGLVAAMTVQA